MLGLFGCGKKTDRVDYHGSRSSFTGAKDSYAAGTEVVLYYDLIATDTDYSFRLDGEPLNPGYDGEKGYVIRFTMPADAPTGEKISVTSVYGSAEGAFMYKDSRGMPRSRPVWA